MPITGTYYFKSDLKKPPRSSNLSFHCPIPPPPPLKLIIKPKKDQEQVQVHHYAHGNAMFTTVAMGIQGKKKRVKTLSSHQTSSPMNTSMNTSARTKHTPTTLDIVVELYRSFTQMEVDHA